MPDAATIVALIGALASTIGLMITSLRKRQDTTVEELRTKASTLEDDRDEALKERDEERESGRKLRADLRKEQGYNVSKDRKIFLLRRTLAQNGIDDPTINMPDEEELA